ncbi:MAG: hypothetical protein NTY19_20005 [Planctomycetota bacterium]|nr:hypothetical protein [Planctomycetota bacterium]
MNRWKLLFFGLLLTALDASLSVAEAGRLALLVSDVSGVDEPWPLHAQDNDGE